MLVTIKRASLDDFENVVLQTKEKNLMLVEQNKLSEMKTDLFRYRNLDVFVNDVKRNIENIELFYIVDSLFSANLTNEMLVRPLCALLADAKVELSQVFINKEANSYIQNEICSVGTTKVGHKLFIKSLRPLLSKDLLEQIQKDIEEL